MMHEYVYGENRHTFWAMKEGKCARCGEVPSTTHICMDGHKIPVCSDCEKHTLGKKCKMSCSIKIWEVTPLEGENDET